MYIKRQWICYNMLTFPSLYGTPSTSKKSHLYLKMRYFFRHDSAIDGIRQDAPAHLTVVLLTHHQLSQYSACIFFTSFASDSSFSLTLIRWIQLSCLPHCLSFKFSWNRPTLRLCPNEIFLVLFGFLSYFTTIELHHDNVLGVIGALSFAKNE